MARKLIVEIVGDSRSLERAFDRSSRSAKTFSRDMTRASSRTSGLFSGISRAAGLSFAGIAAAAGYAAKESVEAASDLGEQMNKTNVVFGESAKQITRWSETTAEALGISRTEALEMTGVFGNMLRPMGFTEKRAARMSRRMVKLGADMASFNNASPEETLDAIRAGLAGESEPLRRFGVFLNDARVKQEALTEGLWDGEGQLSETAKAAARYNLILEDTTLQQGDFARTSDSLANQQRILKAQIADMSASIGQALLPIVRRLLGRLTEWLSKSRNQKRILDAVEGAVGAVTAVVRTLRSWLQKLNSITGSTKDTLKLLLAVLVAIKVAKFAAAFANIATALTSIGTQAATANTKAGGLLGTLRALGRIGVIAVTIELFLNSDKVDRWLRDNLWWLGDFLAWRPFAPAGPRNVPVPASGPQGFGPGGPRPGRTPAPAGPVRPPGGREAQMVVHGNLNVYGVQDMREFEREVARRSQQRSQPRRGVR